MWHHWLALVLGAFLFLAWSALSLPTTFTVVATSLKAQQHTMGIGVQSMVRRVPMMLGPLAGGWLITHFGWEQGVKYALLLCIGLTLLTMAIQWFMFDPGKVRAGRADRGRRDKLRGHGAVLYTGAAGTAGQRHPDPLLRAHSLRLRRVVGDGLRRR